MKEALPGVSSPQNRILSWAAGKILVLFLEVFPQDDQISDILKKLFLLQAGTLFVKAILVS